MEEQKYIEANRETLDKMLQQEQESMAAQAPGSLFEVFFKKPEVEPEQSDKGAEPSKQEQDPAKKA